MMSLQHVSQCRWNLINNLEGSCELRASTEAQTVRRWTPCDVYKIFFPNADSASSTASSAV